MSAQSINTSILIAPRTSQESTCFPPISLIFCRERRRDLLVIRMWVSVEMLLHEIGICTPLHVEAYKPAQVRSVRLNYLL